MDACATSTWVERRRTSTSRPARHRRPFASCSRTAGLIGRRFKLAHVFYGPKIIETSTFRTKPRNAGDDPDDPLITHDNEWGSVEDDARRRDFTINALFFDVENEEVVDFVDGLDDLDRATVRTIGEPELRFREDPVRMIRAVKFAARLGFEVEPATWDALLDVTPDIVKCSRARLLEEVYKLLRSGASKRCFELLIDSRLLQHVMPSYTSLYGGEDDGAVALEAGLRGGPSPTEASDDAADENGDDEEEDDDHDERTRGPTPAQLFLALPRRARPLHPDDPAGRGQRRAPGGPVRAAGAGRDARGLASESRPRDRTPDDPGRGRPRDRPPRSRARPADP